MTHAQAFYWLANHYPMLHFNSWSYPCVHQQLRKGLLHSHRMKDQHKGIRMRNWFPIIVIQYLVKMETSDLSQKLFQKFYSIIKLPQEKKKKSNLRLELISIQWEKETNLLENLSYDPCFHVGIYSFRYIVLLVLHTSIVI